MSAMSIEEMREYMSRPEGNCWVGVSMANGNTAMVSRYGITEEFICEYDGNLAVMRWKLTIWTRL